MLRPGCPPAHSRTSVDRLKRTTLTRYTHLKVEAPKKLYAPYSLSWTCSKCNTLRTVDFAHVPIPGCVFGVPTTVNLKCEPCSHTDQVTLKAEVVLEIVTT